MKIEDEIQQKAFTSEFQKLIINFTFTYNWMSGKFQAFLKSYGISSAQFNILRILRGQNPKPASIQLLKERMLDKNSDCSRIVDRLVKKVLVERKVCKDDRRQADIFITQKGLELLSELDKHTDRLNKNLLIGITENEAAEVNRILDKLRTAHD